MPQATLILVSLIVVQAVSAEDVSMSEAVRGNNQFAVDLHAKLRATPGNLFYSPGSLATALAMTYAGARGETAAEMARVLHFTLPPERLHAAFAALSNRLTAGAEAPGLTLRVANRLWGQAGYHFLPDFLAITRDSYGAGLAEVDFIHHAESARLEINDWVARQTRDKITDLIARGVVDARTRLVLTNAIDFKGDWSAPFPKAATQDDTFHVTSDKTTRAPLMTQRGHFRLAAADGLKLLELPYAGGDLALLVLLPDAIDGLTGLEDRLTETNLTAWLAALRTRDVKVFLPRFRLTAQFCLADVLRSMGMRLAFDRDRADFSGMSTEADLYIWAVLHKAFVDVNEEGTEAAAATAVVMTTRAAALPAGPVTFRADHPFLFLIRDNRTGLILFLGRVANPSA